MILTRHRLFPGLTYLPSDLALSYLSPIIPHSPSPCASDTDDFVVNDVVVFVLNAKGRSSSPPSYFFDSIRFDLTGTVAMSHLVELSSRYEASKSNAHNPLTIHSQPMAHRVMAPGAFTLEKGGHIANSLERLFWIRSPLHISTICSFFYFSHVLSDRSETKVTTQDGHLARPKTTSPHLTIIKLTRKTHTKQTTSAGVCVF